jgi:hypothetical protein
MFSGRAPQGEQLPRLGAWTCCQHGCRNGWGGRESLCHCGNIGG